MIDETSLRKKHFRCWFPEEAEAHVKAARQEMRKSFESIIPVGFFEHRRKARKEMLLAWRSMIDAALKRMEEP